MLMIGNSTPDLEVEALMPDGRFERLRLGALLGRWAVLFFYPKDFLEVGRSAAETLRLLTAFQAGGLTACEWHPGDGLLVPV